MQLQGLTRNPGGQKSERMTILNFKNYQNFKYYENVKKSRKDIILFSWGTFIRKTDYKVKIDKNFEI